MREVPRIVAETKIESEAPLTVWRDNKKVKTKLKVAELEKAEEEGHHPVSCEDCARHQP